MNSHQNSDGNEMDLKEGLNRLGQRYGQLQQDEPPELLDLAILNSAHRAVEKKPHWMKFGWLHGLTTAAVFVLAFTLILNQPESPTIFENGLKNNEPVSLQGEIVAKKQSLESKSGNSLTATKEKHEARQEMLQTMPAAAVAESPVPESAPDDEAGEPAPYTQRGRYVRESKRTAGESSDKDAGVSVSVEEEIASDEKDLMDDSLAAGAKFELNVSSQLPEPAKSDAGKRAKTNSDVQQKLLEIIKLKQSGDETWKKALESFKESYPDYPLPDELTR